MAGADRQSTHSTNAPERATGSRRSVFLILGGLIVVGLAAGYSWLRGLPKD
jgi:hypothetical protein